MNCYSLTGSMATTKCHEGMCTSCALCKKPNAKYTHPIQLSSDQQVCLKLKEYKPNIPETACICLPWAKQLKRLVTNPTLPQKCGVEKCTNMVHKSTNLMSVDELERLLGVRVVTFDAGLAWATISWTMPEPLSGDVLPGTSTYM